MSKKISRVVAVTGNDVVIDLEREVPLRSRVFTMDGRNVGRIWKIMGRVSKPYGVFKSQVNGIFRVGDTLEVREKR